MNKFDEMLEALNKEELSQSADVGDFTEDLPESIRTTYFANDMKCVATDLDPDGYRWYEESTVVYKVGDRFLGVRGVSKLYSESMDISDCGVTYGFFEMKEVQVTSYKEV